MTLKINTIVYADLESRKRGSPVGFSGSGIWLIKRPGFGIWGERGERFVIVYINETQNLGILQSGIREMTLNLKNRDTGSPVKKTG